MVDDKVVVTEARIIERVEEGERIEAPRMRLPEMLMWLGISLLWYAVIRVLVTLAVGLPWVVSAKTPEAAASWMMLGLPVAATIGAFLTLQTHTRNRELYTVMTLVVLLSALVFHIDYGLGNPFVARANASARNLAYFLQLVAVLVGAGTSLAVVRWRRSRRAAQQPALPGTA